MRSPSPWLLVGIALSLASGYVLLEGGHLSTRRDVIAIGELTVSAETQHPVRPWMAGLGLALGASLVVFGATRKS